MNLLNKTKIDTMKFEIELHAGDERFHQLVAFLNLHKIDYSHPPILLQTANVSNNGFISSCCEGEKCRVCDKPATKKLEETIFHDDPNPMRHPLTAYVCEEHFTMIVGMLG